MDGRAAPEQVCSRIRSYGEDCTDNRPRTRPHGRIERGQRLHPIVLCRQTIGELWRPGEPRDSGRVMLRSLDLVELIVSHPGFRIRLCDGKRAIGAALKAMIDAVQNER